MSTVAAIDDLLTRGLPVTMAAVGGRQAVEPDADALARSPHIDVLVSWAIAASQPDMAFADDLVVNAFEHAGFAGTFRPAADALIGSSDLSSRLKSRIGKALEARSTCRANDRDGLVAAYALETWLRLALGNVVQRHRLLSILVELEADDNGLFLEHAAKIVGAAFHAWREEDLISVLERLRKNPTAGVEASFEHGNALLSIALDGDDWVEVIGGLEAAAVLFTEAVRIDPDRSEAMVYSAVIDVVGGFARNTGNMELERSVEHLKAAAADRAFLLSAGRLPEWLRPRSDRDVQWIDLLENIPRLAADLGRPSWLRACEALDLLLTVYDADRTVVGGAGFGELLRPRIEASFIREKGLLAHLDDRLCDEEFVGEDRVAGARLRERIAAMAEEPFPLGKSQEGVDTDWLRGVLENSGATTDFIERIMDVAEGKLVFGEALTNPAVQRVFSGIRSLLAGSAYYGDDVRTTFDSLVLQVILFCLDRQDAARKELGRRGEYLFIANPLEADLQLDLREFLRGNLVGAGIHTEVEGVAKGRSDIYVGHGGWRFLIELKRHEGQVTSNVARRYIGQAASYQGTNVKLGMLGILEIVDRTGPPPGLEDCIWYDSVLPEGSATARHLVVFKVPGRLRRPSELSR